MLLVLPSLQFLGGDPVGGDDMHHSTPSREGIAIDGSRNNRISNNVINLNSAGGIFLYKNCGEYVNERPSTWSSPIMVNRSAQAPQYGHVGYALGNGVAHVAWVAYHNGRAEIFYNYGDISADAESPAVQVITPAPMVAPDRSAPLPPCSIRSIRRQKRSVAHSMV